MIGTNILDTVPLHFIPVVDGDNGFLPKSPMELMSSGEFNQVPIIMGFNKVFGGLVLLSATSMVMKELQILFRMKHCF